VLAVDGVQICLSVWRYNANLYNRRLIEWKLVVSLERTARSYVLRWTNVADSVTDTCCFADTFLSLTSRQRCWHWPRDWRWPRPLEVCIHL